MCPPFSENTPPNGEVQREPRHPWQKPVIKVLSVKRTYNQNTTNNDGNGTHTNTSS